MQKVIVVGAGLVGSLWAVFLARRGYQVEVYERRHDMRQAGYVGGRSINLAMSARGWNAIEKAGLAEALRSEAIPMSGRMMHAVDGKLTYQAYGREGDAIYSVSRGGLNLALLRLADEFENVHLHFECRCEEVDFAAGAVTFTNTATGETITDKADMIFGTDGAFSAIRGCMQRTERFNYSQTYLEYGYKELTIVPGADGDFAMPDVQALHIWPRGKFMLIALPNTDKTFTCTLFLPFEGPDSFENLTSDAEVQQFFERYFADTLPLIPDLLHDFRTNPTSSLVTVRCSPWHVGDKVMLLGDAAHAIVPFYGQGMNAGFEDCTILDGMIERHGGNWPAVIEAFNRTRITDANAVADLALRNFTEMRDLVADPNFLLRQRIAAELYRRYPDDFTPLYSLVSFSHTPYHVALREGLAQDELFGKILALPDIHENWQTNPEVDALFKAHVG